MRVNDNINLNWNMSIITIIHSDIEFCKKIIYCNDEDDEKEFTLKDCYNTAVANGYKRGCIIVLKENPLSVSVYRYGNHGEYWEEIGTLKGYA